MMPSNRFIKSTARALLIGRYSSLILAGLLAEFLSIIAGEYLVAGGSGRLGVSVSIITSLIVTLLTLIIQAGFHFLYLQIARGYQTRLSDIFYCFGHQPDKVILMSLFFLGINLLWIIPFVLYWVTMIRIPLTTLIGATLLELPGLIKNVSALQGLQALLVILIWFAGAFLINLRYTMAFFVYLENPSFSAADSLRMSRRLLAGHKQQLAGLMISFAGLAVLVILSLGLAGLWVGPYFSMCMTVFYLNLTAATAAEHDPHDPVYAGAENN